MTSDRPDPGVTPLDAATAPGRTGSNYPAPFADRVAGRVKQALGDPFDITNFGVNRTTLAPGAVSALLHRHTVQEELVIVLEGHPTLRTERGAAPLFPGAVVGFPADGPAHQIVNETDRPVVLLEIGDRTSGDFVTYPEDDLTARATPQGWAFTTKGGSPYA